MNKLTKLFDAALVVKSVEIDESCDCKVTLVARKPGLTSWLLSVLGIDATTTLRVYGDRIESVQGSLNGSIQSIVPLDSLDTYNCGFTKPIHFLVLGIVSFLFSLNLALRDVPNVVVCVLFAVGIAFIAGYIFKRCLVLGFSTQGINGISLLLRQGMAKGVMVDHALVTRIIDIVNSGRKTLTKK